MQQTKIFLAPVDLRELYGNKGMSAMPHWFSYFFSVHRTNFVSASLTQSAFCLFPLSRTLNRKAD